MPKLSAWAYIHGAFDFNRTPIAPPGTHVRAHVKPDVRGSWAPHGLEGWYVGPAWDSYRCYTVWIVKTRAARICDTITWFPTHVRMPAASSTDYILAGIADIVHALQSPTANAPFAPLSDSHTKALTLLMDILHAHVTTDPEALRVATKNKDLDESLRVTAKNKDLNLQMPPTTPTDHATIPTVAPTQPAAMPRSLPPAAPGSSVPVPCVPMRQQAAAPLRRSPCNHPGSH